MGSNRKWLLQEIERWIKDGIVDRSQADRISELYPEDAPARNWGPLIFSVIGSVIFGLGIILLFAYNWDAIPKFAKLALVFSALIGAHGAGLYFRTKGEKYSALSESLFALGTMIFGAGIWLVAQIYHIDEHYPNAFIVWSLGALMLAWAMPSVIQGVMASILLLLLCWFENFDFNSPTHYSTFIILLGIIPLAWLQRSRILMAVALPALALSVMFNCHYYLEHQAPALLICLAGSFIAASIIVRRLNSFPESSGVFKFYGYIIYWISLYIFTFPSFDRHIFRYEFDTFKSGYVIVLAIIAFALWLAVFFPLKSLRNDFNKLYRIDHFAIPLTVIAVTLSFGWLAEFEGWAGAAIFNIIFLFQCIMLISYGCRNVNSKLTAAGTVLLAFLAFARYADLFDSLLVRGIVFLGVGAGIFVIGMLYSRRKKEASEVKP